MPSLDNTPVKRYTSFMKFLENKKRKRINKSEKFQ